MKKIILIILVITLVTPQPALCLRPMASKKMQNLQVAQVINLFSDRFLGQDPIPQAISLDNASQTQLFSILLEEISELKSEIAVSILYINNHSEHTHFKNSDSLRVLIDTLFKPYLEIIRYSANMQEALIAVNMFFKNALGYIKKAEQQGVISQYAYDSIFSHIILEKQNLEQLLIERYGINLAAYSDVDSKTEYGPLELQVLDVMPVAAAASIRLQGVAVQAVPLILKKEVKGFKVFDCLDRKINYKGEVVPEDESLKITPGAGYDMAISSCAAAMIIFDKSGLPVGIAHFDTSIPVIEPGILNKVKEFLTPDNFFLIVYGTDVEEYFQKPFIMALVSYLEGLNISSEHIYCHGSEYYKKIFNIESSGLMVTAQSDEGVRLDYVIYGLAGQRGEKAGTEVIRRLPAPATLIQETAFAKIIRRNRKVSLAVEQAALRPMAERLSIEKAGIGSATGAFRLRNSYLDPSSPDEEDIFIMTTTKCPFKYCMHCMAKDQMEEYGEADMDEDKVFSYFEQLRGFGMVTLVGPGEPTAYGTEKGCILRSDFRKDKVSEAFLRQLRYAEKCGIKNVRVFTNAYLVPETEAEAEKFFAQFPKNIIWLVSTGEYHQERMAQMPGRSADSARNIIRVMQALDAKGKIRTAYNLELSTNKPYNKKERFLKHFGLTEKYQQGRGNVFFYKPTEQGEAARRHMEKAMTLERTHEYHREDIEDAVYTQPPLFFITMDRLLVTSPFVAFMTAKQRAKSTSNQYLNWSNFIVGELDKYPKGLELAYLLLSEKGIFDTFKSPRVYTDYNFGDDYENITSQITLYWYLYSTGKADDNLLSERAIREISPRCHDLERLNLGAKTYISAYDMEPILFKAIAVYLAGDITAAKAILSAGAKTKEKKDALINFSYFLLLRCQDLDIRSFMIDCLADDFQTGADKFRPEMATALEILEPAMELRRSCEGFKTLDPYKITEWEKDPNPNGNYHSPVYTREHVAAGTYGGGFSERKEISVKGPMTKTEAAREFSNNFGPAKIGIGLQPLGILHARGDDKFYYVEETVGDLSLFNIYLRDRLLKKFKGQEPDYKERIKTYFEKLGCLAAAIEKTGYRIKPDFFTEQSLGLRYDYSGLWVLTDRSLLSKDVSLPQAKNVFLSFLRKEMRSGAIAIMIRHLVCKSFRQGYNSEMLKGHTEKPEEKIAKRATAHSVRAFVGNIASVLGRALRGMVLPRAQDVSPKATEALAAAIASSALRPMAERNSKSLAQDEISETKTIKIKKLHLHQKPLSNMWTLSKLLLNNCGIVMEFILPAVDIIDDTGFRFAKEQETIPWRNLIDKKKLPHFYAIDDITVVAKFKEGKISKKEFLDKAISILEDMMNDGNIHFYMTPLTTAMPNEIARYREDMQQLTEERKQSLNIIGRAYFYKYLLKVGELAKEIKEVEATKNSAMLQGTTLQHKTLAAIAQAA